MEVDSLTFGQHVSEVGAHGEAGVEPHVGTRGRAVLCLYRYLIVADEEVFARYDDGPHIGYVSLEVSVGGEVVVLSSAVDAVSAHFVPVDVNHQSVVYLIVEGDDVVIGKREVEAESVAEVVGWAFGSVGAAVELRGGIVFHEVALASSVAEGSHACLPAVGFLVEGNVLPIVSVHRTAVEVLPFRTRRNQYGID